MTVRGTPILTGELFRPLTAELIALLRGLSKADWKAPTSAPGWSISDVCAHMLDGDLRRLSVARDDHALPAPDADLSDYTSLLAYLNQLNAEWVSAARRLSPRVITDLLETVGRDVADLMERSDPLGGALFPVAWAGETHSTMWLDIGREYTERWHHQDQIREAVGAGPLRQPHWLRPVIEISLMALPHAYRNTTATDGTRVALEVRGDAGGNWYLEYSGDWRLERGRPDHSNCTITVEDLALARLLLHRLASDESRRAIDVTGESGLASPILAARAVMV
jgi:uncharacterized protein (TIGR03083 family)